MKALKSIKIERQISMEEKRIHKTSVGGQALIEGVMMQGPRGIATAVRKTDGDIVVKHHFQMLRLLILLNLNIGTIPQVTNIIRVKMPCLNQAQHFMLTIPNHNYTQSHRQKPMFTLTVGMIQKKKTVTTSQKVINTQAEIHT